MKYTVFLGIYPTEQRAKQEYKKVESKCRKPRIEELVGKTQKGYIVVLFESDSFEEARKAETHFIYNHIHCAILEK